MTRPSSARETVAAGIGPAYTSPAPPSTAGRESSLTGWRSRLPAWLMATTHAHPAVVWPARPRALGSRIVGVRALGGLAFALAGNSAFAYPRSSPGGESAVIVGTATVVALVTVGLNMQASEVRARMGRRLVCAAVIFSVLLLEGSSDHLAFSIGSLGLGLLPPLIAYLFLAYPAGRLHSPMERRLLFAASIPLVVCWSALVLTSRQPPFATPLLRCTPHCPPNDLFLGFSSGADSVLWDVVRASWIALAWGWVARTPGSPRFRPRGPTGGGRGGRSNRRRPPPRRCRC